MTNLKPIIIENRNNTKALSISHFENNDFFKNWKADVEALRLAVSNRAVAARMNAAEDVIIETTNDVFDAYRKVLSWFTDKSLGEKLKAQGTDLDSLLTMAGASRKQAGSEEGKQFLPVGATTFRKNLEDFLADRLTSASYLTAEDIEAARKAKNKRNAENRKARKKADKAKKAEKSKEETTKKSA